MKRITLAFVALTAGSVVGLAQEPPTPPTPPVRPAPAPAPTPVSPVAPTVPAPAPRARPVAPRDFDYDIDRDYEREIARHAAEIAREASRIDQDQVREMAREQARIATEAVRIDQDHIREMARVDAERVAVRARDMVRDFAYAPMIATPHIEPMPAMAPMAPMAQMATPFVTFGRDFTDRQAPAPWVQGDPADSVYRIAREALNNGDYGRAARTFNEVVQKYGSKSQLTEASQYYEALARYKIGTTDELHQASKILEPMVAKVPAQRASTTPSTEGGFTPVKVGVGIGCNGFNCVNYNRSGYSDSEIRALYIRVNSALAQRGDNDAAKKVQAITNDVGTAACDRDAIDVQSEALNALANMDAATAMPALKRVLERKDDCSAQLRRSAVFILGRRSDTESANLLIATAKTDPSREVRMSAINYLGRLPGDVGLAALEDLLKNDPDVQIQRAAIRALNSSDNPRARTSMRALIERKDAQMELRLEAIRSFNSDRITNDDAAYLRGLYAKADNDQMREEILNTLGRIGGTENDAFILSVAKDTRESSRLRGAALNRLSRSTVPTADLAKIYDAADSYDVRSRIVQVFASRKDAESADKLIDIVKTSTDTRVRREALLAINRRNDPRAQQLMMDILDGKVVKP